MTDRDVLRERLLSRNLSPSDLATFEAFLNGNCGLPAAVNFTDPSHLRALCTALDTLSRWAPLLLTFVHDQVEDAEDCDKLESDLRDAEDRIGELEGDDVEALKDDLTAARAECTAASALVDETRHRLEECQALVVQLGGTVP